jgi:GGDEF domain-containing protein
MENGEPLSVLLIEIDHFKKFNNRPGRLPGTIFASVLKQAVIGGILPLISRIGEHVGDIVRLIPKHDLERARLIQEARAIYERIFPPEKLVSERRGGRPLPPSG